MDADLPRLFDSDKAFPSRPTWKRRDRNALQLVSPLDIEGVTIEGLRFRATAILIRPDEAITFQLEYHPARKPSKGGPFARFEWKPLRGHNNKMIGPAEFQNLQQRGTHFHDFHLNWNHSSNAVKRGDLPISVPIENDLNFQETLVFVGEKFRISTIEWIPVPPWEFTGVPWETLRLVQ